MNSDFVNWATGFSGCDGGNLHGGIWFCGIEWGGEEGHKLENELRLHVSEPPQLYAAPGHILQWPHYGAKLMKLIAAISGRPVQCYEDIAYATPFPFHRESDYFKLNLFPIAYRNKASRRWPEEYVRLTGIPTLESYFQWCRNNRFPRLRLWVERGQPRLVVGIGIGDRHLFAQAFGASELGEPEYLREHGRLWHTTINAGKTHLAIVPFLGGYPGCLRSDAQLQAFGARLGTILNS